MIDNDYCNSILRVHKPHAFSLSTTYSRLGFPCPLFICLSVFHKYCASLPGVGSPGRPHYRCVTLRCFYLPCSAFHPECSYVLQKVAWVGGIGFSNTLILGEKFSYFSQQFNPDKLSDSTHTDVSLSDYTLSLISLGI